jgi:SPP1 family predicted phage head-tail adaptor
MQTTLFDPGQLTARLDLESPVDISDGQGGVTRSYTVAATLWARIEPVTADLIEIGEVERQNVTHRIWLRHADAIVSGMRFRKGARLFWIRTVHDPDDRRRYLVCRVTEGADV